MISAPTENERTVTGMDEYIEREAAIESIMSEPPDAHYPQWYADKIKPSQPPTLPRCGMGGGEKADMLAGKRNGNVQPAEKQNGERV